MRESSYAIVLMVALVALQSAAVTIHRSFRTREAGVGFGTGGAGVAYPVDAKVDKAIDEARQKVRIEWQKKDRSGRILGTVRLYKP